MQGRKLFSAALIACVIPSFGLAQDAPVGDPTSPELAEAPVGGKSAIDFIRIDSASPSVPLRNAGVIRNSEQVDLDGKPLKRGVDYTLDYGSGMLILMKPVKPGQSLRITYRHDPSQVKAGGQRFGESWNSMKLNFNQGTSLMMGLGMAERRADGTVMRSDLYALKNSFGLAPGGGLKMNGMFAYSSQKGVQSQSLLGNNNSNQGDQGGSGIAIVQEIGGKLAGGNVSLQYQSIDSKFTGFNAFSGNGFTDAEVNALSKEKGLKRFGLSIKDVQAGSMKLSQNFSMVGDKGESIRSQSVSLNGKGWSLDYAGRKVDQGFRRFADLRDADRELLRKESGLSTSTIGLQVNQGGVKLGVSQFGVKNQSDKGLIRNQFGVEVGNYKLGYSSQSVDAGFNQFQGVRQADAGQLAREQGMKRTMLSFEANKPFSGLASASFSTSTMANDASGFQSMDFTLNGSNWMYDYAARSTDPGFDGVGRQSEAEQNAHIARIAKMYDPRGIQTRPEERQWFSRPQGMTREMHRIQFSPGKGIGITADQLNLVGATDSGSVTTGTVTWGATRLNFRRQALGNDLVEISSLMGFERERLGNIVGLNKTDFSLETKFSKTGQLFASDMSARAGEVSALRRTFQIKDTNTDIRYTERQVDSNFFNIGQLVDPERELLGQLIGQEQRQLLINTMLMRGLSVKMELAELRNDSLQQQRSIAESLLAWDVDKDTKFQWYRYENNMSDPTGILSDQSIDRLLISRNFSGLGALSYERETRSFDGSTVDTPDSVRNTVTAETRLSGTTSIRTEQTQTNYEDGTSDRVSAHTLSTGITKDAGVSVTDVDIRRTGLRPSERRRNYGFWVNLGNGVKFTYGYARELGQNGTLNSTATLTGGQIGGLTLGGGNYQHQRWDGQRDKSTGNFKIGTTKPIRLGFLQDFQFSMGTDTVRDYNSWNRENQSASFGARMGDVNLGFDYSSQIHNNGGRAVDRAFRFSTANDPKRKLVFDAMLKHRSLPWDQQYMMRNVSVTARFIPGFEVVHQIQTYPEQQRGDALLGSVAQPVRSLAWKINQTASKSNTRFGFAWDERINEQTRQMTRLTTMNLTLNANNPSPITMFYGVEQGDQNNARRTVMRYGFEFNQRPGPNALLNVMFGNVAWHQGQTPGLRRDNWTMRAEYQLRF